MDAPQSIELERHLDLAGRSREVYARRALLALLALIPLLALANVFGQRPSVDRASGPGGTLEVDAPSRLRGGLLYMGMFTIRADRDLRSPRLVLDPGWVNGMQVNTVTPAPASESSRDGRLVYHYGDIHAGERVVVFAQFQVNPTSIGRRSQGVALEADGVPPLVVRRAVTIFP